MTTTIFLHEEQIRELCLNGERISKKGFAISMDNDTVVHVFTKYPQVLPAGKERDVWFVFLECLVNF